MQPNRTSLYGSTMLASSFLGGKNATTPFGNPATMSKVLGLVVAAAFSDSAVQQETQDPYWDKNRPHYRKEYIPRETNSSKPRSRFKTRN